MSRKKTQKMKKNLPTSRRDPPLSAQYADKRAFKIPTYFSNVLSG